MNPSVAILMPYYNYPIGLARTLGSLRAETAPFTLYLVDDGSSPPLELNTADYPFPIKLFRLEKNAGIEAALNRGLEEILADGHDYIARMDTGDLWIAGRLDIQRDFLISHPDHVLVGSWAATFDETGAEKFTISYPAEDAAIRRYIYINSAFCHVAAMFRADAMRRAGPYALHYPAAEDYEFFWRLLRHGKGANIPAPWVRFEITAAVPSISYHQRRRQLKSRLKIQMRHFNPGLVLSWWGMLRTAILLYLPQEPLLRVKTWLWGDKLSR